MWVLKYRFLDLFQTSDRIRPGKTKKAQETIILRGIKLKNCLVAGLKLWFIIIFCASDTVHL